MLNVLGGRGAIGLMGRTTVSAPTVSVATYTVTTTGAETHTINALGVAAGESCRIDWGDGTQTVCTGSASRTHPYATAGVWTVTIENPAAVRTFDLRDAKATVTSAGIRALVGVTTFMLTGVKGGRFDSADVRDWRPTSFTLAVITAAGFGGHFASVDVSDWRPTVFYIASLATGYTGVFNSADMRDWRPATFRLQALPDGCSGSFVSADVSAWRPSFFGVMQMSAGFSVVFDSVDVGGWRPTYFYLGTVPGASVTAGGGFAAWTTTSHFSLASVGLTQATVDAVLWELYQATKLLAGVGVLLDVGGTNAPPSGVYQAAQACPVTAGTPGKEIAHELKNDGCAVGLKKWGTVTIAA
jgi:hypothetical protein